MYKNTPVFTMLIGLPGTGKSTWLSNEYIDIPFIDYVPLSTDAEIEKLCAESGITYNQGFNLFIDQAQKIVNRKMSDAIKNRDDIVLDQTNITRKSRARKMAQLPREYKKYALFFPIPNDAEWKKRLSSRPGKCIPQSVLDTMLMNLEMPSIDEGFDEVIMIKDNTK
jgi:predicted kinase